MAHDSGRGLDAAGREECLLFKSGNGDTPRGLFQESQHTGPLLVHDLRRYTEYSSEWVRASRRGVFVAGTLAEHWYSRSSPESGSTETTKATVKCHPHAVKPIFLINTKCLASQNPFKKLSRNGSEGTLMRIKKSGI